MSRLIGNIHRRVRPARRPPRSDLNVDDVAAVGVGSLPGGVFFGGGGDGLEVDDAGGALALAGLIVAFGPAGESALNSFGRT